MGRLLCLGSGSTRAATQRGVSRYSSGSSTAPRWRSASDSSSRSKRRAGRSRSWPRSWAAAGRRASVWASGGSPRSSHEPSGRRISSPRSASSRQRGGDGRPAGADELAEDAVGERERHDHALAGHAAPALGEVPEQRAQAAVHARELRDRLGGGEAHGALAHAVEQRGGDLRVARDLGGEAAVEHRDGRAARAPTRRPRRAAGWRGCRSATGARGRRGRAARRSRGRRPQLAREHAVEHQQADVVGAGAAAGGSTSQAPTGTWWVRTVELPLCLGPARRLRAGSRDPGRPPAAGPFPAS